MPADEAGRAAAGMAAFHCYNSAALAGLDSYLRLDAAHGMESAAVIWGSARLVPASALAYCRAGVSALVTCMPINAYAHSPQEYLPKGRPLLGKRMSYSTLMMQCLH